jgi:TPP-dependent pyruvate/acetoin dehydrogenase alpha subunit
MHRNLGVFTSRNMPFDRLFAQWQGTMMGYTKSRDRSFHFGTNEHHLSCRITFFIERVCPVAAAYGHAPIKFVAAAGKVP